MENLQAHGTLRVSRKSRKGRKKKTLSDKNENEEEHGDHDVIQNEIGLQLWTVRRSEHVTERSLENSISDRKQGGFVQIGPKIPVRGT